MNIVLEGHKGERGPSLEIDDECPISEKDKTEFMMFTIISQEAHRTSVKVKIKDFISAMKEFEHEGRMEINGKE